MILFISFITSLFSTSRPALATRTSNSQGTQSTNTTTSTTDQYTGRTQQSPQERPQPPQKSFWGRVWGATRGVLVTLTATIVTGALIASGVGIVGIAIAIGAGILAGTAVGAATNAVTAIANGGTKQAWNEAFQQTVQDFKSSCIGAVSAACGFGVARLVTGTGQVAASASLGTRLLAGSAAGGTGATVSTVAGTVDQSIQLRRQFESEHGQINSSEKERQYQEFLKHNKATWEDTIKNSVINIFTGFVSGGIGAKFQLARAANQSAISQGLNVSRSRILGSSVTAEATVLTGTGFTSSYLAHGHVSLEEAIQHVGGSYAGSYLGKVSSNYTERRAHQMTRQEQNKTLLTGRTQSQQQPRGRVLSENEIPPNVRNSLNYARKRGDVRIELIENPPAGFRPHADVLEIPNPSNGTRQRQTVIRISDLSQLHHELRHTNRNKLAEIPKRNPDTGRLDKNDVRRYLAQRALEEFQVIAARDPLTRPNSTAVNNVKEMQKLIRQGDFKGAVKYASRNGVGRDYRRGYIADARESLISGGKKVVQRGNLPESQTDTKKKLSTLANEIESAIETPLLQSGNDQLLNLLSNLRNGNINGSNRSIFKKAALDCGISPSRARKLLVELLQNNSRHDLATQLNKLISSYHAARTGTPGQIRTNTELSSKQVTSVTNKQLMLYKSSEIRKLIKSFSKEDRPMVIQLLKRMTQFGNIQSLDKLNNRLIEMLNGTHKIYSDKGPALASNLQYLDTKSALSKKPKVWTLNSIECILTKKTVSKKNPAILVDEYTLQRLEAIAKKDPYFISDLKNKRIKLILPEGWDTGISFANQGRDLKSTLQSLVTEVKAISTGGTIPVDRAIGRVLNGSAIKRLEALGLQGVQVLRIVEPGSKTTSRDIARQLNPVRMSTKQLEAKLQETFQGKNERWRDYARELIAQDAQVFSPRRMSKLLERQNQKILELAKDKGIAPENIVYYIPEKKSSYGLIQMMYASKNKIPSNQIVSSIEGIKAVKGKKLIVVLDDITSSGTQPFTSYKRLQKSKISSDVVFCPLIASAKAVKRFEQIKLDNPSVNFMPCIKVKGFKRSDYLKSLSEQDRKRFYQLMQDDGFILNGHGGNALNTVFPQMAPNSNNAFWNAIIASLFLPSSKGARQNVKWQLVNF